MTRRGALACAAACLLAVAACLGPLARGPVLAVGAGDVSLTREGTVATFSSGEHRLRAGDVVNVLSGGRATVRSSEGSRIEIVADTEIAIEAVLEDAIASVNVAFGRSLVAPGGGRAVLVRVPSGEITVARARVFVTVDPSGQAEAEVLEGEIEVAAASASLRAPKGQTVKTNRGLQPVAEERKGPGSFARSPLGTPVKVAVSEARYGTLVFRAAADLECTARLTFPRGAFGETPPLTLTGRPDAGGAVSLTYPTPRIPSGQTSYLVECGDLTSFGAASGTFPSELRPIRADGFTVQVETSAQPPGGSFVRDDRLIGLRDRAVAELRARLAGEWRAATRGLGSLAVLERAADIAIKVLAGTGTSSHWTARDGTEEITIFVADRTGPIDVENIIAVALHELGHIWCCRGPGTSGGHWTTREADPTLSGIDRFGLMNEPVQCFILRSGVVSCPNRFSVRELREMGFERLP